MDFKSVGAKTVLRLPKYLCYLKSLPPGALNVSATAVAEALSLNDVQVRKDLALVSKSGRPRTGYVTKELIFDLEQFLGYNNTKSAVLAGAGHLGQALLSYEGFLAYGLDIVAAFETDGALVGKTVAGKQILSADKLESLCRRMKIRIGIIAVPGGAAQEVCDRFVKSGISAVWNFAPVHLSVPENVLVQSENMASSLACLSNHLTQQILKK